MTKIIVRTSSMLNTPPQDKLHKHLHIFNSCEHSCIMMIMVDIKMSKTEYDFKAIMYPGGRLNKKDGLTRYGNSHVKDKTS